MVVVVAILLIAACAVSADYNGFFTYKNALLSLPATAALAWAVWDAWRPRQGALHYAAGDWVLVQGDTETVGTLQVVLDLQVYVLVGFTPLPSDPEHAHHLNLATTAPAQWLHLESRHARQYGQDWRSLRRALFAAPAPALV
jgi:hypothetical protein